MAELIASSDGLKEITPQVLPEQIQADQTVDTRNCSSDPGDAPPSPDNPLSGEQGNLEGPKNLVVEFGASGQRLIPHAEPPIVVTIGVRPGKAENINVELHCAQWRRLRAVPRPLDPAALAALDVDPELYGDKLGRSLFEGSLLGRYFDELRGALLAQSGRFRVRLGLEDEPSGQLRWERLKIPWGATTWLSLATNAKTPLSRIAYYDTTVPQLPPIQSSRIRALLVIASPADLPPHLVQIPKSDRDIAKDALRAIGRRAIEITILESGTAALPSISRLREELTKRPHIVHVLCHGEMDKKGGALFIEDDGGQTYKLDGETFAGALQSAGTHPRLVMLAACASAAPDTAQGARAVAPVIVERGAEAVLAMHGPITLETARSFTRSFYDRLYEHGEVDLAVAEARCAVKEGWDWSVPVLLMRHDSGRIIEFEVARSEHDLYGRGKALTGDRELLLAALKADKPRQLMDAMEQLNRELAKSHQFLVNLADSFRRTGSDPASFPSEFEKFTTMFDTMYAMKTWIPEQTSCHRVRDEWSKVSKYFSSVIEPQKFEKIQLTMDELSNADWGTIKWMQSILDKIDEEARSIADRLEAGDVAGAIAGKRAFERRLFDSFRRSKEFLQAINDAFLTTSQKMADYSYPH